ncbi:peptidyl-prolyl cis-trans isomerase FKBP65-like protein [Cinnamomum micranthum f. kanehirae]|uniref:peptidylprolyl isomerase n=1 Tax=Cinnamomum micranthum f. kanehirae TaxID=337451 RepID=A0A443N4D3_9MAGN|nr:peptidyl-prolyl cis-trans isomerase FKBP65-like protein [Cinnamomum micranthum f. kanehirae]
MDDIDEATAPPKPEEEEEFRPYYPEKAEDEGFLTQQGLKKKLSRLGEGWLVPEPGDEITVHYRASVLGGLQFTSSKDKGEPLVMVIGQDSILKGCEEGLLTMRKGEIAIFTVPPKIAHGVYDIFPSIPFGSNLQFEVELISWLKVVDVCGDGGIMKKILSTSEILERAQKKDEVTVKYDVKLEDGTLVARTTEDGVEFLVTEGHLCPAIAKTVVTMRKGEKAIVRVEPKFAIFNHVNNVTLYYAFGNQGRSARDGFLPVPPNAVVIISLELAAFKLIEYITEDMRVVKKITNPMETFEKPNSGTVAQIRYVAKLVDGTIFDRKGYDGEEPFEFKVDEEQVINGLDLAVATMKQGEVAQIIINHEYGFGNTKTVTDLAVVPPLSTLYYEVELVAFTKVKESWDMEPEEKIEYAAKRKQEGNAYFKDGKYQRASLRYEMAAKYVEFDNIFTTEQKRLGRFFKVTCNLNNAVCRLKLKEFREAAKLCSEVLKLESRNVKALFRRAQAYIETNDLDLAELDLKKALEMEPDNGEVNLQLARLKKLQSYYKKKESKLFVNMLGKLRV